MESIGAPPPSIVPEPPGLTEQEWLIAWASQRGMAVASQEDAYRALFEALQAKGWAIRLAATDALRVRGDHDAISVLKAVLKDEHILVREGAYLALYEISRRTGVEIT